MKALIVDDEPLARDVLRFFLENEAEATVVGECADGEQAIESIRREAPDLVFLDVQMPGLSGIDVVRHLDDEMLPEIIFVTAYDRHALEAFELHAIDYLLKPVEEARFKQALERAKDRLAVRDLRRQANRLGQMLGAFQGETAPRPVSQDAAELDRLLVRKKDKISVVRLDQLDWVEAAGDYVYLHCGPEKHLLRRSLGRLESQLDPTRFRRIHRQTVVNLERIAEVRFADHGDLKLRLLDGTLLKVSRTYRQALDDFLS